MTAGRLALAEMAMSGTLPRSQEIHLQQEAVPERGQRADGQMVAVLPGQPHLELRVLPDAHQRQRVLLELLAGARERGAALGAVEQGAPEHVFEPLDARAHGRLRDVHLARSIDEAACLRDHQERARESDVHAEIPPSLPMPKSIYRKLR